MSTIKSIWQTIVSTLLALFNTQKSAPITENSSTSGRAEVEMVKNTPFSIVKTETDNQANCFIAIGKQRITEFMAEKEAWNKIQNKTWELILMLCTDVAEKVYNHKQNHKDEFSKELDKITINKAQTQLFNENN